MNEDLYAVFGNPVAHSLSPWIHARFAAQTGQAIRYTAILAPRDGFAVAVRAFVAEGGKGANVTLPFKQEAWALAHRRSARAERAGAVNTFVFRSEQDWFGDNTDGAGLLRDLTANLGIELRDRRILIAGAGGAARGILEPLLAQRPREVIIANRTVQRAIDLAAAFAAIGPVHGCGYDALSGAFDGIVNATSAGVSNELPPIPPELVTGDTWCYDLMYRRDGATAFVEWARAHGAGRAVDGLGMLVEQAAESFSIWRGVRPETRPIIEELRAGAGHAHD